MSTKTRILIAGIGNIFMGDDAFGVEVAKRLMAVGLPEEVKVVDFGIRSYDLAFKLFDDFDLTIFVDAVQRDAAPGTLYVIEPDLNELDNADSAAIIPDGHTMNPMKALGMFKSMGGQMKRILIVGCQPATLGDEDEGLMGLSEPVLASIDGAIELIESLINKELNGA